MMHHVRGVLLSVCGFALACSSRVAAPLGRLALGQEPGATAFEAELAGAAQLYIDQWHQDMTRGRKATLRSTTHRGKTAITAVTSSYCRQCLCDIGSAFGVDCVPWSQDFATTSENVSSDRAQCLKKSPCCDCAACRQGWTLDEYPQDSRVGLQCENACARCETGVGYTLADVQTIHPPLTAEQLWGERMAQIGAMGWANNMCQAQQGGKALGLGQLVEGESTCLAAAIGPARSYYCACSVGNKTACSEMQVMLEAPALTRFARGNVTAEALVAGFPAGWFCSSPQEFVASAASLFSQDLDQVIRRAIPAIADEWAFGRLHEFENLNAVVVNRQVSELSSLEVRALASELFKNASGKFSGLESTLKEDLLSERNQLNQRVVSSTNLSADCLKVLPDCTQDAQCWRLFESVQAAQDTGLKELVDAVTSFNGNRSVQRALRTASECASLPEELASAVRLASSQWHPTETRLHASSGQGLAKAMLGATLAAKVAQTPPLSTACVAAQQACAMESSCKPLALAMTEIGRAKFLDTLLGFCDKPTFLQVLEVAAECPGPLAGSGVHQSLLGIPEKERCARTQEVISSSPGTPQRSSNGALRGTPAAGRAITGAGPLRKKMLRPLSVPCVAAHQRCGAGTPCALSAAAMSRPGLSVKDMLSEALKLCNDKNAALAVMEVAAECPGRLPEKEMRESHGALSLVPQPQLCGKMGELVDVLGMLLTPVDVPVAPECVAAREECKLNARCSAARVAANAQAGGTSDAASVALTEALRLCYDRDAMLLSLKVAASCETSAEEDLQNVYESLEAVAPAKLCASAQGFVERLSSRATAPASPISDCVTAHARCGGIARCGAWALAAATANHARSDDDASTQPLAGESDLCDDGDAMYAALEVTIACPHANQSYEEQAMASDLFSSLPAPANAPRGDLCTSAFSALVMQRSAPAASELPSPLPGACVVAQQDCAQNDRCRRAAREMAPQPPAQMVASLQRLCDDKPVFHLAVQTALMCPGPLARAPEFAELRKGLRAARRLPLPCGWEAPHLAAQRQAHPVVPVSSSMLASTVGEAADEEAPRLARVLADRLFAVFDVAPNDGKLNAVETHALSMARTISNIVGMKGGFTLEAADTDKDGFTGPQELAASLAPALLDGLRDSPLSLGDAVSS